MYWHLVIDHVKDEKVVFVNKGEHMHDKEKSKE